MITLPVVTSLTAALIVALQLALMLMVGFKRLELNQGLGDGGQQDLLIAIRRHGNLAENSALFLVTLALVEILGGSTMAVAIIGATFVVVGLGLLLLLRALHELQRDRFCFLPASCSRRRP